MCGEHAACLVSLSAISGSSPRVRGTRLGSTPKTGTRGIIPACAGNTPGGRLPHGGFGDHPRVCGEHSEMLLLQLQNTGSSPRVRGTQRPCCRLWFVLGIIPACAGNTLRG